MIINNIVVKSNDSTCKLPIVSQSLEKKEDATVVTLNTLVSFSYTDNWSISNNDATILLTVKAIVTKRGDNHIIKVLSMSLPNGLGDTPNLSIVDMVDIYALITTDAIVCISIEE